MIAQILAPLATVDWRLWIATASAGCISPNQKRRTSAFEWRARTIGITLIHRLVHSSFCRSFLTARFNSSVRRPMTFAQLV